MPDTKNNIILEKIFPVSDEMASSFCCCLASVLLSRNAKQFKFINRWKPESEHMRCIYTQILTASGLGFSYVFKKDHIEKFDKTEYYKAFNNDKYITYALAFGRCNYRIISADECDMQSEIINSLHNNMPVIAEGVTDHTWGLITGCTKDISTLYGYTSGCWCCQDCVDCINRKVDCHLENDMFVKSNWKKSIKRIIVIENFDVKPVEYKTFIKHWISVMKHEPQNGFLFGQPAYDAHIQFLENDDNFHGIQLNELHEIYRFIFTNCFIPEYRIYTSWGLLSALGIPQELLRDSLTNKPTDLGEKIGIVMKNGHMQHNIGYKFWAALSEKGMWQANAKQYSEILHNRMARKKAITQLKKIKELDAITLQILECIV